MWLKRSIRNQLNETNNNSSSDEDKIIISNKWKNGDAKLATECQEEFRQAEARRHAPLREDPKLRCWKTNWADEVSDSLSRRNILLKGGDSSAKISKHLIVIDHTITHHTLNDKPNHVLKQINFIRLKKEVLLLRESLGNRERSKSECYANVTCESLIQ